MKNLFTLTLSVLVFSASFAATAYAVNVSVPQSTGYGQILIGNAAGGSYSTAATSTVKFFTLTTTGSSGAATYSGGTLNIPQYTSGGGSGVGTISTSSAPTRGALSYWTTSGSWPELLGSVSTTTLTTSGALSFSQPVTILGTLTSALSLDTTGTWTGNAGTASALAADGSNCPAGYYPLGVSTTGAAQSCTYAFASTTPWSAGLIALNSAGTGYTIASSSLFGYTPLNPTRSLTIASGNGKITLSAGAQDLSADRTWTATYTGLATTSQPASSNLLVSDGGAGVFGVATGTITCTGTASCSTAGLSVIGGNLTITGTGGGGTGLATTSPTSNDNVLVYTSSGAGAAYGVATTSLSFTGPFNITNPVGVLKNGAVTYWGLATTSQPTSSQLLVSNGGAGVFGVSTTTTGTALRILALGNIGQTTITYASTTAISASDELVIPASASEGSTVSGQTELDTTDDQLKIGDGSATAVFDPRRFYSFGYSTSTAWTGTTTIQLAPYPVAGTLKNIRCTTDIGTLGVDLYYGPTPTHLAYIPTASTTANVFTWSSSNTPGANASSTVAIGTPASSPTKINCTAVYTVTGT